MIGVLLVTPIISPLGGCIHQSCDRKGEGRLQYISNAMVVISTPPLIIVKVNKMTNLLSRQSLLPISDCLLGAKPFIAKYATEQYGIKHH